MAGSDAQRVVEARRAFAASLSNGGLEVFDMKYSPGQLVMNAGKNEGLGYIWRVQSYHTTNPFQKGDRAPYIHALCLRPLRGKVAPMDWWIGNVMCNPARNFQPFTGFIPPVQMALTLTSNV